MRTIDLLIEEKLSEVKTLRSLDTEDRMDMVYRAHPKLRSIDNRLIAIRTDRLTAALENIEDRTPYEALRVREKALNEERDSYIKDNNIDPEFDRDKPRCMKCNDTGYIEAPSGIRVVCGNCMSEKIEEAFMSAGLSDYSSYTLKAYDPGYYGNRPRRSQIFKNIKKMFEEKETPSLRVYCDTNQTGKTFLSIVAVKYAIVEGRGGYYIRADELMDIPRDELDDIEKIDFLVIDDYSGEVTLKWSIASNLNRILEIRGASGLPTLLVSSLPVNDLENSGDQRIASKITKAGRVV